MKYALHAVWLAIKAGDFPCVFKLLVGIKNNAKISNQVFNLLDE